MPFAHAMRRFAILFVTASLASGDITDVTAEMIAPTENELISVGTPYTILWTPTGGVIDEGWVRPPPAERQGRPYSLFTDTFPNTGTWVWTPTILTEFIGTQSWHIGIGGTLADGKDMNGVVGILVVRTGDAMQNQPVTEAHVAVTSSSEETPAAPPPDASPASSLVPKSTTSIRTERATASLSPSTSLPAPQESSSPSVIPSSRPWSSASTTAGHAELGQTTLLTSAIAANLTSTSGGSTLQQNNSPSNDTGTKKPPLGLIIGLSILGALGFVGIILILFWFLSRRKNQKPQPPLPPSDGANTPTSEASTVSSASTFDADDNTIVTDSELSRPQSSVLRGNRRGRR